MSSVSSVTTAGEKSELRRFADGLRSPTEVECDLVADVLAGWLEERLPTTVLTYLSMPGEIPAERVVTFPSVASRHEFATTRTPPNGWLTVHPIDTKREEHRFGYSQPADGAEETALGAIGIVFVPGRVFDLTGGRVGWGRGYYDELLSRLPDATTVGVTLQRRLVTSVPVDPHDIRMDFLVTELGMITAQPPTN